MKQKGANLATHEDIEKLKEQVRIVTTTTKEIETRISNEAWDRQKRWELKREVLFEGVKGFVAVDDALVSLNVTVEADQKPNDINWLQFVHKQHEKWKTASMRLDEADLLLSVVCTNETIEVFRDISMLVKQMALAITRDKSPDFYHIAGTDMAMKQSSNTKRARNRYNEGELNMRASSVILILLLFPASAMANATIGNQQPGRSFQWTIIGTPGPVPQWNWTIVGERSPVVLPAADAWQTHIGTATHHAVLAPEPGAWLLVATGMILVLSRQLGAWTRS